MKGSAVVELGHQDRDHSGSDRGELEGAIHIRPPGVVVHEPLGELDFFLVILVHDATVVVGVVLGRVHHYDKQS